MSGVARDSSPLNWQSSWAKIGRVVAVDLQQGMLDRLRDKISGSAFEQRITLVKCEQDNIAVSEAVDFILTFYMVHEVPDKESFFRQLGTFSKTKASV